MIKIGEFSKFGFVTVATLRHYDEIGLLKPARVEPGTGYRYYTADQLPRIQYVVALKNLGVSLEDIARLLDDNMSVANIRQFFLQKRSESRQRVADEQRRLAQVERLLEQLDNNGEMPRYQVTLKKLAPVMVASVREVLAVFAGEKIAPMFQEVIGFVLGGEAKPAGPTMLIYNDDDYKEDDADIEVVFPIDRAVPSTGRVKVYELPPVATAATLTYQGSYEDMGESYNAVMSWVASNGYRIDGACRELYLVSPADTADPSRYVSEIQVPVTKA